MDTGAIGTDPRYEWNNDLEGGSSGDAFEAFFLPDESSSADQEFARVKHIALWQGIGPTGIGVTGLQLSWDGDDNTEMYGKQSGFKKEYDFDDDEHITAFNMNYDDTFIRYIQFGTTKGEDALKVGKEASGYPLDVHIGDGGLVGIRGMEGDDIFAFQPAFTKESSMMYQ